jgi:hypothetical protein
MANTTPPIPTWRRNLKDILAGTAGGVAVTLVGHPFDTVKVSAASSKPTAGSGHPGPALLSPISRQPLTFFHATRGPPQDIHLVDVEAIDRDDAQVLLQTQPAKSPVYNGVLDCVTKTVRPLHATLLQQSPLQLCARWTTPALLKANLPCCCRARSG